MSANAALGGYPASYRRGRGLSNRPAAPSRIHRPANDNPRPNWNPRPPTKPFGRPPAKLPKPTSQPKVPGALRSLPASVLRRLGWLGLAYGAIEWLLQPGNDPHYDFPAAGFALNCKLPWNPAAVPPFDPPGWAFQFYAGAGPGCSLTAFVPFADFGGAPMVLPASRRTVGIGPLRNTAGTRFTHAETWTLPANNPGLVIPWVPAGLPVALPQRMPYPYIPPWIDPESWPVEGPQPNPNWRPAYKDIPKLRPNPDRAVGPVRGYGPAPAPAISATPRNPAPPPRGTKERKLSPKLILGRGAIELGLSAAGESADLVSALYDALPWYLRGEMRVPKGNPKGDGKKVFRPIPGRGITDKAGMVFDHFDQIDLAKALGNVVSNQIEDAILGRIGRIAGRASAVTGVNIQVGPAL